MASSFIQGSLAISRDETSGNNLDVDQLNVIDPGASMETRTVQAARRPSSEPRYYPDEVSGDSSDPSESSWNDEEEDDERRHWAFERERVVIRRPSVSPPRRERSPPPMPELQRPMIIERSPSREVRVESREFVRVDQPGRQIPEELSDHTRVDSKRLPAVTPRPRPFATVTEESSDYSANSRGKKVYEAGQSPSLPTLGGGVNGSSEDENSNHERAVLVMRNGNRNGSFDDTSALRAELEALRAENIRMRQFNEEHKFRAQPASTCKTFYLIRDTYYLDEPHWEPGDGTTIMSSKKPIRSFDDYVEQHPDIAFAIIKQYDPHPPVDRSKIERDDGAYRTPEPFSQVLSLLSGAMIDAVEDFVDRVPQFHALFPSFNARRQIDAPYLFMFHSAQYLPMLLPEFDARSSYLLTQLEQYIQKSHGFEYDSSRSRAKEGRVSNDLFGYLIRPGDVLVNRAGPRTQAYLALDWPKESDESRQARRDGFRYDQWDARQGRSTTGWDNKKEEEMKVFFEWTVPVWRWAFDGSFERIRSTLSLGVSASDSSEIIPITQLGIIPLDHAPSDVRTTLEDRGKMFWTLRHRRFVSCLQTKGAGLNNVADRFMVDVETYKKLHPKAELNRLRLKSSLSYEEMQSNDPPLGNSLLLFPPQIPGFDLLRKSWVDLYVDYMSPVVWNKQAFEDLVVHPDTKELVQALVMKQLDTSQSTDFIAGKGNGLIVLLHGGPGTGKTFTAEGVAEFAEKPLLRVTCGDVGTVAEVVERKLQSSFHLGKIWDCVVLLDEADVFLEERDMKDLNRNALVSVFLRELEYYDGILILTSNRVGTFDEAFKSRIQLSLHYENLGLVQRRKIWRNFINRVKTLDPTIDYEDILDNLDELSKVEMNGREIRNTITTARQLAHFKGKALGHDHLDHVLRVNGNFGKYLNDLRDGLTEDDVKRESGLRLSYKSSNSRHKESPF